MNKAPMNRSIMLSDEEIGDYAERCINLNAPASEEQVIGHTINQDLFDVIGFLPAESVDLMFIDPPYNLTKTFKSSKFSRTSIDAYSEYIDSWLSRLIRLLKPNASVYICGDYLSSTSIHLTAGKYLRLRNRITWQREKGRGAMKNWKNSSEDIWFFTKSDEYKFYVDRVKEKRFVLAPYRIDGKPKDWQQDEDGRFRLTHPSNIWTDLSVPYWSMPENTEHPTQKPEKLLAKIILAGSDEGDVIFDPFLGSGTTSVTAKKLGRRYYGVELDRHYAALTEKRLEMADDNKKIQGYSDGVFWERNSLRYQK